jgi:SAM-dependent methyltransferase
VEWYEVAFGRIYPLLYRHRSDDEAEIVLDAFGDLISGRDPVLDLACGGGRYMVSAAKRRMSTGGVDLSEILLTPAAGRPGLRGRLVRADMRRLPYGGDVFGAVLNMFTSFGYFEGDMDNLLVLREVSRVLKTGGLLLMDYVNATKARSMVLEDTVREAENWLVRESRLLRDGGRYLVKAIEAQNGTTGDVVSYEERVRLFSHSEMVTMLESVDMVVSGVFGDYDRSGFDEEHSDRLILLCEKR